MGGAWLVNVFEVITLQNGGFRFHLSAADARLF